MKRIVIVLLLLQTVSAFTEEISPLIWSRKKGSMNIGISGSISLYEAAATGMSGADLENYLWSSATGMYSDQDPIYPSSIVFEINGDYYLRKWLSLHATLACQMRKYTAAWAHDSNYDYDIEFTVSGTFLSLSVGPRLYLGFIYIGAEAFFAVPVAKKDSSFVALHATEPTHTENPTCSLSPDYGVQFSGGIRWRWSERLFSELGATFSFGLGKVAQFNSFTPLTELKKSFGVQYTFSISYAIK